MLTAQELKSSPLFHDISYEEYRRMLTLLSRRSSGLMCRRNRSMILSSRTDAVGIVERGQVS